MTDDSNIPMQINPDYLKHQYVMVLAELESIFAEFRNGSDEERLATVERILGVADAWMDESYEAVGITPEIRAQADEVQLQIMAQLSNFLGYPEGFDLLDPDERDD